jgi:hypothetical protein
MGATPPDELPAIHVRQHEIEHDRVGWFALHHAQRGSTVPGDQHAIACIFERRRYHRGDRGLVFDHHDGVGR